MINNYDHEIEKQAHPENFEPDLDTQIGLILAGCDSFSEFCFELDNNFIHLAEDCRLEYWNEYWSKYL